MLVQKISIHIQEALSAFKMYDLVCISHGFNVPIGTEMR